MSVVIKCYQGIIKQHGPITDHRGGPHIKCYKCYLKIFLVHVINLGQWHKFRGSVLLHSRPIKQGCKCMPACLSVRPSACLSICPYVNGRGPAAVLLHLAASNNLMGCLICTSDFLHRQCSTFSTLIFRLPLLTSQKLKTNTHVSTHINTQTRRWPHITCSTHC